MNPLTSRKATIGWVVSVLATALAGLAVQQGWVPPEKQSDLIETLIQVLGGVWSVIALGHGLEDAGQKVGLPPSAGPVNAPPLPLNPTGGSA